MKPNAQMDEKTAFIGEVSKMIDNLSATDEATLKKCCFTLGTKLKVKEKSMRKMETNKN